jgi:hypothetical protein
MVSHKNNDMSGQWLPWHAVIIPQRITIIERVTLAPRRFMSRVMGSTARMYETLFDHQAKNIRDSEKSLLSYGQGC